MYVCNCTSSTELAPRINRSPVATCGMTESMYVRIAYSLRTYLCDNFRSLE